MGIETKRDRRAFLVNKHWADADTWNDETLMKQVYHDEERMMRKLNQALRDGHECRPQERNRKPIPATNEGYHSFGGMAKKYLVAFGICRPDMDYQCFEMALLVRLWADDFGLIARLESGLLGKEANYRERWAVMFELLVHYGTSEVLEAVGAIALAANTGNSMSLRQTGKDAPVEYNDLFWYQTCFHVTTFAALQKILMREEGLTVWKSGEEGTGQFQENPRGFIMRNKHSCILDKAPRGQKNEKGDVEVEIDMVMVAESLGITKDKPTGEMFLTELGTCYSSKVCVGSLSLKYWSLIPIIS